MNTETRRKLRHALFGDRYYRINEEYKEGANTYQGTMLKKIGNNTAEITAKLEFSADKEYFYLYVIYINHIKMLEVQSLLLTTIQFMINPSYNISSSWLVNSNQENSGTHSFRFELPETK